jgi:hypothetical protein
MPGIGRKVGVLTRGGLTACRRGGDTEHRKVMNAALQKRSFAEHGLVEPSLPARSLADGFVNRRIRNRTSRWAREGRRG